MSVNVVKKEKCKHGIDGGCELKCKDCHHKCSDHDIDVGCTHMANMLAYKVWDCSCPLFEDEVKK